MGDIIEIEDVSGRSKPQDLRRTRSSMPIMIKATLDKKGIEIPFPYRTLNFAEPPEGNATLNPKIRRNLTVI